MKSGLFPTALHELLAPDHYSLTATIRLPLILEERRIPLHFSQAPRVELLREPGHRYLMSPDWLLKLMKRLTEQYATIQQTSLQCAVSLQGELGFNGTGRDIELSNQYSESKGLYFEVSRLVISDDPDMLFQNLGRPIERASELGSRITTSYEIVHAWIREQEQYGLKVS